MVQYMCEYSLMMADRWISAEQTKHTVIFGKAVSYQLLKYL